MERGATGKLSHYHGLSAGTTRLTARFVATLLGPALLATGCASVEHHIVPAPAVLKDPRLDFASQVPEALRTSVVPVFFAATRARSDEAEHYADHDGGGVTFGVACVQLGVPGAGPAVSKCPAPGRWSRSRNWGGRAAARPTVRPSSASSRRSDLSRAPDIEYSALRSQIEGEQQLAERGVTLWLAGLNPGVLEVVHHAGFDQRLGCYQALQPAINPPAR